MNDRAEAERWKQTFALYFGEVQGPPSPGWLGFHPRQLMPRDSCHRCSPASARPEQLRHAPGLAAWASAGRHRVSGRWAPAGLKAQLGAGDGQRARAWRRSVRGWAFRAHSAAESKRPAAVRRDVRDKLPVRAIAGWVVRTFLHGEGGPGLPVAPR